MLAAITNRRCLIPRVYRKRSQVLGVPEGDANSYRSCQSGLEAPGLPGWSGLPHPRSLIGMGRSGGQQIGHGSAALAAMLGHKAHTGQTLEIGILGPQQRAKAASGGVNGK